MPTSTRAGTPKKTVAIRLLGGGTDHTGSCLCRYPQSHLPDPDRRPSRRCHANAALVEVIEATGAKAIIPSRSHRNTPRKVDRRRYKARNPVERFFNRLKQFRRIATRYDKLANRFNAFLHHVCAYIWLLWLYYKFC
ncbi:MAG: transposase [Candidatus Accumulibacter sp.]|nr:transposase [Accumulibacter sp.]